MNKVKESVLIERLLKGDTSAYSDFIDSYQNYIFNTVKKFVNNRQLAEEVTQDVFLKIFKSLSTYQREAQFSTWIYRIAYTTSMNEVRKRLTLNTVEDFEEQFHNLQSNDDWDNYKGDEDPIKIEINKAVNMLPKTDSMVVTLFYMDGHSVDEISSILQIDKNTIKVKLYRARKKIKNYLSTKFENDERFK